jgi:hypothetical protein
MEELDKFLFNRKLKMAGLYSLLLGYPFYKITASKTMLVAFIGFGIGYIFRKNDDLEEFTYKYIHLFKKLPVKEETNHIIIEKTPIKEPIIEVKQIKTKQIPEFEFTIVIKNN